MVRGFQLPPTISFEERRKLEALSVKALLAMEGDLAGEYFPLNGSKSYKDVYLIWFNKHLEEVSRKKRKWIGKGLILEYSEYQWNWSFVDLV